MLVSGCLLGLRCRYDGKIRRIPEIVQKLIDSKNPLIPVCPEQLGGLPTPRPKNHLAWRDDKPEVINEEGTDVTLQFVRGAEETLSLARLFSVRRAILKSGSPSCGKEGVTTRLLEDNGIEVAITDAPRE
ncbi:DUF523 domain-containing protein [candidate division WOR-3 bacterium]|uniref:DUF523 domain-containing protein n=1 Tax=candidate division WOR-3 bacterium TaxID=2052148 RepID=A0A9D5K900_UNCW3|nr:DUF523 domain-containing protein [candidate division WOR-3 bacterium]MBD3364310.1 DUF523 domain-containing protein [candidate division WOR-3 bacterium]